MIFASKAKLQQKWATNVRIEINRSTITRITENDSPQNSDTQVDTLLPSLGNLHSHSFQRAMAGMTEYRTKGKESFWTWRELMYRFLDQLTPEQIQAIAAMTFVEMQEAGFAAVGEFHYVHHQLGGQRYQNQTELSDRVFAAAQQTGIGLTHLPVLYSYGGAQSTPLAGGQLRFGNTIDQFQQLVSDIRDNLNQMPLDTRVGIAPHSLRATTPDDLKELINNHKGGPVHIHIAEQPKEVEDINSWLDARPVEWLLANHAVNEHWCLIHATHMTDAETQSMASTGAVAGLCPITEANLGDGPFNGPAYLAANGAFGLGSDSNVRISLTEELRTLEYSQRLRDLSRNVMVNEQGSVGEKIYTSAALGGAQALGRKAGLIKEDYLADLVAIDSNAASLCALAPHQLLDGLCFAASDSVVTDTWSAGRHCVRNGQHVSRQSVLEQYRHAISELINNL